MTMIERQLEAARAILKSTHPFHPLSDTCACQRVNSQAQEQVGPLTFTTFTSSRIRLYLGADQ